MRRWFNIFCHQMERPCPKLSVSRNNISHMSLQCRHLNHCNNTKSYDIIKYFSLIPTFLRQLVKSLESLYVIAKFLSLGHNLVNNLIIKSQNPLPTLVAVVVWTVWNGRCRHLISGYLFSTWSRGDRGQKRLESSAWGCQETASNVSFFYLGTVCWIEV